MRVSACMCDVFTLYACAEKDADGDSVMTDSASDKKPKQTSSAKPTTSPHHVCLS